MKQTLIIATALGLAISCRNAETSKASSDTSLVKNYNETPEGNIQRQQLIKELERLQSIIMSNDKQQVASIFQFPLSDTTAFIHIQDSTYEAELVSNGDKTTRSMFLRFFPQISESLQIEDVNEILKNISLEELMEQDTLEREVKISTEPCFKFYGIEVQGDLVTLTKGQGVNSDFKSSVNSTDETPENSSEFCESVFWWIFKFDGKRLTFVKQNGAG